MRIVISAEQQFFQPEFLALAIRRSLAIAVFLGREICLDGVVFGFFFCGQGSQLVGELVRADCARAYAG